ncbi:MAG: DUF2238 domain-containing protein [Hydrogenovibrio sp.]|nr:DUF2238 domain-containing protein [Hydrogenovibrio sp.]
MKTIRKPALLSPLWLGIFFATAIWSIYQPTDFQIWVLEAFPALAGLIVLALTFRTFPLTPMVYWLILAHCVVLFVGAHYTYAEVPLFDWLQSVLGHERNNYDKLGHLMQGLVPAMIAREILLRKQVINGRGWLNFLIVCFALALSAVYELVEWLAVVASDSGVEAFLGTQGYIWDTQSDMFYALIGAIVALMTLTKPHDRQLARMT